MLKQEDPIAKKRPNPFSNRALRDETRKQLKENPNVWFLLREQKYGSGHQTVRNLAHEDSTTGVIEYEVKIMKFSDDVFKVYIRYTGK